MDNETKISLSFKNNVDGEKKLERYQERLENIYALISGLNGTNSQNVMQQLTKASSSIDKNIKATKSSADKLGNSLKTAFNLGKVSLYGRALYNLTKTFMQLSQKSTEYIENVNLLEVAYKNQNETIEESSARIEKYIQKMADVYGLDESRLTRQFGIFKQLANAMQLPTETAENLSEIMVKMTNDIASLYNLDLNRASNALQSALAGQVRPIRSATGADITEKTLQNTVVDLGLDRSISELSYVEKRLIMVISLTNQLKVSQGDYARTIESASNQIRVMHEQWDRLSRAVGNVFYPILEKILPWVNGLLMALTEIANLIASLFGFKMPEFDYSGLSGVSDLAIDIEDEMAGAGEATDDLANKLKGLRSFDKLNVINTPSASKASVGGGGVGGSGYVDPTIMDAFNKAFSEYDDKLESVRMKASKIKDDIMEWLGFTKQLNPETGKIEWKYQGLGTTLKNIWKSFEKANPLVKTLVGFFVLWTGTKIITGLGKIVDLLFKTNGILLGFTGLSAIAIAMDDVNEKGLNLANTLAIAGGSFLAIFGSAKIGYEIGGIWGGVIGSVIGVAGSLIVALINDQSELDKLVEKSKEALTETEETASEIQKNIAETEMEIASSMSLTNYHEQLLDELNQIMDANGQIKQGYEDRASYILNELSQAYGVEYQLIDGVLQESDKVKQSIKDQIALKEQEIILEAYKQDYIDALKRQNELYNELTTNEENRNNTLNKINSGLSDLGITYEEYLNLQERAKNGEKLTAEESDKLYKVMMRMPGGLSQLITSYNNYDTAVKNSRENYENNVALINRYSDYSTAVQTGNMEEIDKYRDEYTKTWVKDGQVITNSEETEANKRIETQRATLKEWKENNDERYTNYKQSLTDISNYTDGVTPEIAEKWTALGNTSSKDFMKEFKKLPEDIQKDIVNEMYSKGYSMSTELQRGLDGYDLSKNVKIGVDETKFREWNNNNPVFRSLRNLGLKIPLMATGGLPEVGQLFVANERGPELISQIGGQSFVANQKQIGEYMDKRYGSYSQPINLTMPIEIGGEKLGTIVLNNLQDLAKTNGQSITIG